ncbi:MAG: GTP-binding protein [Candidatus Nezhaarchaeales archaeon]
MKVKLACIGGFLGSGKTTLMISLGKELTLKHQKKVAIITNDQGEVLVDTETVRNFGFACAEVLQGCFCCKFPEFITHVHEIMAKIKPDIILAEPVGSCTDLLATVYTPLRNYYSDEVALAPYIVLVDALKALKIDEEHGITSPKTPQGYLYTWQLMEAEVICINKVDMVSEDMLIRVERLVREVNDEAEILRISAKTGFNVEKLVDIVLNRHHNPRRCVDVNYDIYGTAEAELGWLNASFKLSSDKDIEPEEFLRVLLVEAAQTISRSGGDVAHIKATFSTDEGVIKGSLTSIEHGVDFLGMKLTPHKKATVIINARAKMEPEALLRCVKGVIDEISKRYSIEISNWLAKSFSPQFPRPYYRLSST